MIEPKVAEPKDSVKLEALMNYLRQQSTDAAFDKAFEWVKDGSLTFGEWKKFVKGAQFELMQQALRRDAMGYRG